MTNWMLNPTQSQLVLVDMQVRLAHAMPQEPLQAVVKNCGILAQAAQQLGVPAIVTEQYPQGLGATLLEVSEYLAPHRPIAKTAFSAYAEPAFRQQLQRDKPMIVLAGMEAHICVLQTALDLLQANKQVFVVEDAVISRNLDHKANGLARLRDAGCVVGNTESVLFEWLGNANHEAFKALSTLIR
jgi:nicotinamidase-related amidase